jgi:RNA polymerase sigma factor (sigma-70 family)
MKNFLGGYWRGHVRQRRGGRDKKMVRLSQIQDRVPASRDPDTVFSDSLALREALAKLSTTVRRGQRQRRVFELHSAEGYTFEEIADIQNLSSKTVSRDWRHARTWLYRELTADRG